MTIAPRRSSRLGSAARLAQIALIRPRPLPARPAKLTSGGMKNTIGTIAEDGTPRVPGLR
ncbi:hypothetical protein [Nocardia iowensis]|uniref:hypothetical protein n=1 Tax=Nocardia iowensis TaxID=204891 RepID=UPI0034076318